MDMEQKHMQILIKLDFFKMKIDILETGYKIKNMDKEQYYFKMETSKK